MFRHNAYESKNKKKQIKKSYKQNMILILFRANNGADKRFVSPLVSFLQTKHPNIDYQTKDDLFFNIRFIIREDRRDSKD